ILAHFVLSEGSAEAFAVRARCPGAIVGQVPISRLSGNCLSADFQLPKIPFFRSWLVNPEKTSPNQRISAGTGWSSVFSKCQAHAYSASQVDVDGTEVCFGNFWRGTTQKSPVSAALPALKK